MAAIEDVLLDLERRAVNEGAGGWLVKVNELKRIVATGDKDAVRAFASSLVPDTGDLDLVASVQAIADAYMAGAYDGATIVARTASGDQAGAVAQVLDRGAPKVSGLETMARDALGALARMHLALLAGGDPIDAAQHVIRHGRDIEGTIARAVHEAAASGTTAVARAADKPLVWVAERNACVRCLAHSGHVVNPGQKFPAGLTFGPYVYDNDDREKPPLHPHCRCHLEVLNDPEYAAALRREAERSVLRGYSLESESMGVRIRAAEKLIAGGVDAPKSVIAYGAKAVKAGKFPTRTVPFKKQGPPDQPRHAPKPPPEPKPPRPAGESPATKRAREAREEAEKVRRQRDELAEKQRQADAELAAKMEKLKREMQAELDDVKRDELGAARTAAGKLAPKATDKAVPLAKTLEAAKTVKEAGALAQLRHPEVDFSKWMSSRGLDVDLAKKALGSVSGLLDRFPGTKLSAVEPFAIRNNRVIAQVRTPMGKDADGRTVALTPSMEVSGGYLRNPERLKRDVDHSRTTGHFHDTGDPITHVITHEFGHALDSNSQYELRKIYARLEREGLEAHGAVYSGGRLVKYPPSASEWHRANTSGYGRSSPAEGVAEAFADGHLLGDKAPPLARDFYQAAVRWLDLAGMGNR